MNDYDDFPDVTDPNEPELPDPEGWPEPSGDYPDF